MSNKVTQLKNRIITQAVKSGIMILGCAIALSVAYYFYQTSEENRKDLTIRESQLKQKIIELEANNNSAANTLKTYRELQQQAKIKPLDLNRKQISNLIGRLSDAYRINNVNINIGTVREQKTEPFQHNTGTIITTDISIDFDSPSDIHAFAFIEDLIQDFSGYLNMKTLNISRTGEVSEDTLRSLLKGGRANFIKTSVRFEWLGVRPNLENKEDNS